MSRFENLDKYENVPDGEKLALLRMELIPLVAEVKGYATRIKHKLNDEGNLENTEEINNWLSKIIDASADIDALRRLLIEKSDQ